MHLFVGKNEELECIGKVGYESFLILPQHILHRKSLDFQILCSRFIWFQFECRTPHCNSASVIFGYPLMRK